MKLTTSILLGLIASILPSLILANDSTPIQININTTSYNSSSSDPRSFVEADGRYFFTANDGVTGRELWVTDGTPTGTSLVKNINVDAGSPSGYSSPSDLQVLNGKVYFNADDGSGAGRELWVSDGTADGTYMVKDIWSLNDRNSWPRDLTVFSGKLFFTATTDAEGKELWVSDGTASGTNIVKDIRLGPGSGSPSNLTVVGSKLFFTATGLVDPDVTLGEELWVTDGTAAGTNLVKDLLAGGNSSSPKNLVILNDKLFFTAFDTTLGRQLWVSDGTEEGTQMLQNPASQSGYGTTGELTVMGGKLYFYGKYGINSASGVELWTSDGTDSGTVLLKDIKLGIGHSYPSKLTVVNNQIYFTADDGTTGKELWVSDGTAAGTSLVKDIQGGIFSSTPEEFTAFDNKLYFVANDMLGEELWSSDGTSEGTNQVIDIRPGSDSSGPRYLKVMGNKLFFNAYDGQNGSELWVLDSEIAVKATQVITFNDPVDAIYMAGLTFSASASSDSALTVLIGSSSPNICTVSGDTVTVINAGECILVASQSGDMNYEAAATVSQIVTIAQAEQTITFDSPVDYTGAVGTSFSAPASVDSGLIVTLVSSTPAVCTTSDMTVTVIGSGVCTLSASQAGNINFSMAATINRSVTISAIVNTEAGSGGGSFTLLDLLFGLALAFTLYSRKSVLSAVVLPR